jgi:hypothetical protein
VKTPASRSSALLRRVTSCDQRLFLCRSIGMDLPRRSGANAQALRVVPAIIRFQISDLS